MRRRGRSVARFVGGAAIAVAGLALLRPWTVRPLHVDTPKAFDATAYVAQAWSRVLDEATRTAVDASSIDVAAGGSPRAMFVKATGTLAQIDRQSRVGIAVLRLDNADREVAIQVGPVIRGTALRDAASFIRFTDFTNQFEFAAVSNALHDRVLADVAGHVDLDALTGHVLTVVGATKVPATGSRMEIVPISITPGAAR